MSMKVEKSARELRCDGCGDEFGPGEILLIHMELLTLRLCEQCRRDLRRSTMCEMCREI